MMDWGPVLRVGRDAAPKTLTEETLVRLRRDIISGTFPPGTKVKSEDLKQRYKVGTSPIREALFQLVGDGLVRADGQRGFRVAELRVEELHDIAAWRAELECQALRRSIETGDVEWESRALAALHKLKRLENDAEVDPAIAADLWEDQHRSFHFALYGACGSPWLLRFCELLIQHGERYRRAYIAYPRVSPSITAEHGAILDAAIARDADRAVALLEAHIRHAASLALDHAKTSDGERMKTGAAKTARSSRARPARQA